MQLLELSWNQVNPDPNYVWTSICFAKDKDTLAYFDWDHLSSTWICFNFEKKKNLEKARFTVQLISRASKVVKNQINIMTVIIIL